MDGVYFVGKATEYETKAGGTSFYIPLLPASDFVVIDDIAEPLKQERARREAEKAAAVKKRADEKIAKAVQSLRRRFSDASNSFSVDAIPVALNSKYIELLRMDNFAKVRVDLPKLSDADRRWLMYHAEAIRTNGASIDKHFAQTKSNK